MQSPENERMRLLGVAIQQATWELRAPIDRVEVANGRVTCWAGGRSVTMTYHYAQGGDVEPSSGRFIPAPGSGSWEVEVSEGPTPPRPSILAALRGIFGRRGGGAQ